MGCAQVLRRGAGDELARVEAAAAHAQGRRRDGNDGAPADSQARGGRGHSATRDAREFEAPAELQRGDELARDALVRRGPGDGEPAGAAAARAIRPERPKAVTARHGLGRAGRPADRAARRDDS